MRYASGSLEGRNVLPIKSHFCKVLRPPYPFLGPPPLLAANKKPPEFPLTALCETRRPRHAQSIVLIWRLFGTGYGFRIT